MGHGCHDCGSPNGCECPTSVDTPGIQHLDKVRPKNYVSTMPRHNPANLAMHHVIVERHAQDEQWGGATHDDEHHPEDWMMCLRKQMRVATDASPDVFTVAMRKIAALAMAALESQIRKRGY